MSDMFMSRIVGIEVWRLLLFVVLLLACLVVGKLGKLFMKRVAARREGQKGEWIGLVLGALSRASTVLAFAVGLTLWTGMGMSTLGSGLATAFVTATRVLNAVAIGYAIYCLVDVLDFYLTRLASRTEGKVDDALAPLVGRTIRITVAVLVIVNVVHVVSGQSVSAIVAGLGVGGLAIALAAQDTVKNFFGSLVILADRPFEIGDRIVVDGHDGPVEAVGFRSTKIRTLDGHVVVVPNAEMANKTVKNISKRPYIRRLMNVGITYDTPPEKVAKAVEILKELVKDHEGMDPAFPPRVFFNDFKDYSLNILVLYWYHPPDYWAFMAFGEKFNAELLKRFNDEGIEFAFPTRTLLLANDDRRQLQVKQL